MFNNQIPINAYGQRVKNLNEKTDVEVLRELGRKAYKHARKYTTPDIYNEYDTEREKVNDVYEMNRDKYFFVTKSVTLAYLEDIILKTAQSLKNQITYKKHLNELKEMINILRCGYDYGGANFLENTINECFYLFDDMEYIKNEDVEYLENNEGNAQVHAEFLIKYYKQLINKLTRIINENELKERLYY